MVPALLISSDVLLDTWIKSCGARNQRIFRLSSRPSSSCQERHGDDSHRRHKSCGSGSGSFRASRVPAATSRDSCSSLGRRSRGSGWRSSERRCPECLASPISGSKQENDWEGPWGQSVRTAAQALGVTLVLAEFPSRQYADAFGQVTRARAEAVFVSPSLLAFADRALVVELATRARVPTMFAYRQQVELGGLMSYGVNVVDNFRRAASFVDRILKGTKPADLPVERPTKFELVINLKTAKALGLKIPQSLLLRADQVI